MPIIKKKVVILHSKYKSHNVSTLFIEHKTKWDN